MTDEQRRYLTTEIELRQQLAEKKAEIARLEEICADYAQIDEEYRALMREECSKPDDEEDDRRHCNCVFGLKQIVREKDKRIAELEPLAKCAIELRTWFLDNEFWNDENSEDIFPILEKHGLVECVEYDPAIHNCDNNEPGDTIWYFPELPTPPEGGEQE